MNAVLDHENRSLTKEIEYVDQIEDLERIQLSGEKFHEAEEALDLDFHRMINRVLSTRIANYSRRPKILSTGHLDVGEAMAGISIPNELSPWEMLLSPFRSYCRRTSADLPLIEVDMAEEILSCRACGRGIHWNWAWGNLRCMLASFRFECPCSDTLFIRLSY